MASMSNTIGRRPLLGLSQSVLGWLVLGTGVEVLEREWQMTAAFALLRQSPGFVRTAVATVLGYLEGAVLQTSLCPPRIGSPVRVARVEDLRELLKGIEIGRYIGTNIPAILDIETIRKTHLAILGTTGSGKSYFTKLLIERVLSSVDKVFVLDPYGEYAELAERETGVEHVRLQNSLFYHDPAKLVEVLKLFRARMDRRQDDGRENYKAIVNWVTELITEKTEKTLYDVLEDCKLEDCIKLLSREFGEEALKNQIELVRNLRKAVNSEKKLVVLDFKEVTDPEIRCEFAGFFLRELFVKARLSGDLKSLIVLEEAHNFVPETSYGDVSAGKDNLAKVYAQKIASEGRKFGLGLVVISQRPAQVSKYLLSQTNTQVLFRIVNKGDIDAIEASIECASREIVNKLPDLRVGQAFITGLGVKVPGLVRVE